METIYNDFREGRFLVTLVEIGRFFTYVNKTDYCWNWIGHKDESGYGRVTIRSMQLLAHVVSYVLHNGAIPNSLHVLHSCDNPNCVNPNHLWLGTHQDNMNDRDTKGRGVINTKSGSASNFAKLTEAEVIEIRKCVAAGAKQRDMVKRFGIKAAAISSIINNKTWKQII